MDFFFLVEGKGEKENIDGIDIKQESNRNSLYKVSCLHNLKYSGLGH